MKSIQCKFTSFQTCTLVIFSCDRKEFHSGAVKKFIMKHFIKQFGWSELNKLIHRSRKIKTVLDEMSEQLKIDAKRYNGEPRVNYDCDVIFAKFLLKNKRSIDKAKLATYRSTLNTRARRVYRRLEAYIYGRDVVDAFNQTLLEENDPPNQGEAAQQPGQLGEDIPAVGGGENQGAETDHEETDGDNVTGVDRNATESADMEQSATAESLSDLTFDQKFLKAFEDEYRRAKAILGMVHVLIQSHSDHKYFTGMTSATQCTKIEMREYAVRLLITAASPNQLAVMTVRKNKKGSLLPRPNHVSCIVGEMNLYLSVIEMLIMSNLVNEMSTLSLLLPVEFHSHPDK